MRTMRAHLRRLAACLCLLPALAATNAAETKPEDREIPPDRGHLFLLDKAYEQLITRLRDSSTPLDKRVEIIGSLALTEEKRAVPDLVRLVRTDRESMTLKTAALWALGEIGDPHGMVAFQFALYQIYLKKPEWTSGKGVTLEVDGKEKAMSLREMCEACLGLLAEPVVDKLADLLLSPIAASQSEPAAPLKEDDERTGRMRAALISLAAVGDGAPRALSALTDVLRADDRYYPWDFKQIAAEALTTLALRRAEQFKGMDTKDPLEEKIASAFIEAAVVTEIPEVRELAGVTLRKIGWADRAARRLAAVLKTPNIPKAVCYHSIEALAFIQSKEAAEILIFLLYDADRNVRWRAAVALGACGDKRALPFLRDLLKDTKDEDPIVRSKAAAALGHLQDPAAIPDLAVAMDDPDFRVRAQAALALGRIGQTQAIPVLVKAGLKDASPRVRAMSIIALGYVTRSEGLKHVPPMLADKDAGVRLVAVQVLSRFLNPGATKALVAALGDADQAVRDAAAAGVADRIERQPKETLDLVAKAIAASKGDARLAALKCLAADYRKLRNTKEPKRLPLYERALEGPSAPLAAALIAALADPSAPCRLEAGKLLVEHGRTRKIKGLLEPVAALANDPDRDVRQLGIMARNYLNNLR